MTSITERDFSVSNIAHWEIYEFINLFSYTLPIGFLCMILLYTFGNNVYNKIVWQMFEQFKV